MAFSSNGLTSRHDKQQKKVEQECLEAALEEGLKDTFPSGIRRRRGDTASTRAKHLAGY